LQRLFQRIMSTKLYLWGVSVLIYILACLFIPEIDLYWPIAAGTFTITFGFAINPVWMVLGMEEMPRIVWRHVASKSFFLLAVFFVLKGDATAFLYPLCIAGATISASAATWYWLWKNKGLIWRWTPWGACWTEIKESRYVFGVSVLSVLSQTGGILIMGAVLGYAAVGTFTLAWRFMSLFLILLMVPFFQALFPILGEQIRSGRYAISAIVNRVLAQVTYLLVALVLSSFWVLPWVIEVFFDPFYAPAWDIYLALIPVLFLTIWNHVLSTQLFINLAKDALVFWGYVMSCSMVLLGSSALIPSMGWFGLVISLYSSELGLFLFLVWHARRRSYFVFESKYWVPKSWLMPVPRKDVPEDSKSEEISLIIPTYERLDVWPRLLESLNKQTMLPTEIIVVDQSPVMSDREALKSLVENWLPTVHCHFIYLGRPNRCQAKQMGMDAARFAKCVVIDDDVALHPDFIAFYVDYLNKHPWALLTTQLLDPGIEPHTCRNVLRYTWYGYFHLNYHSSRRNDFLTTITGACFGFHRHQEVEFKLEPRFLGQGIMEEVDLSAQLSKQGYALVYEPEVPTRHFPHKGGNAEWKRLNRLKWMADAYYNMGMVHQKHNQWVLHYLRAPFVFAISIRTALRTDVRIHSDSSMKWKLLVVIRAYSAGYRQGTPFWHSSSF
jgi:PST family polysaccharide transporter